jgi:signal transduction histidine kinase/phage shock protein PspC (stress-responsive transcriptional regulator)
VEPLPARRLYRSPDDKVAAGVCGGLAEHLTVDVSVVRAAFVVLTLLGGIGVVFYAAFWVLVPQRMGPAPSRPPRGRRPHGRLDRRALLLLVIGGLLLVRQTGIWFGDAVVWPLVAAAVGVALIWSQADDAQRARWAASARHPMESRDRRAALLRVGGGGLLVLVGIGGVAVAQSGVKAVSSGIVAVVVIVAGVAVITGPWWWRLAADLGMERRDRIRAEERAEVAAHLHDSVLQTLALIQNKADQPREVQRLARGQERELRTWLFGPRTDHGGSSLVPALEVVAAEVEDIHGLPIEVVPVGDCPLDDHVSALVLAAKEAMVNASKFSGAARVQVFSEVEGDHVTVFVRDRGAGFEPAAVDADRRGIAESIVGRMARHGGHAEVRSTPGDGTEVELTLSRSADAATPRPRPSELSGRRSAVAKHEQADSERPSGSEP